MINLTINGIPVEASDGSTVLQAAEQAGVIIPTLCHHKDLTPFGGCRLCVVEVRGARLPATACNLPVSPGLVVQTETPRLVDYRRAVLKMLLSWFYDGGYKPGSAKFDLDQDTQFAYWVRYYGLDMRELMARGPSHPIDSDPNPFVWVDMNKCVQCTRCVRACAEIQGRFVWAQAYRGYKSRIVSGADSTMLASRCESCGACVAYCPTGALDNKMSVSLGRADRLVRTTCTYCGVGCQFDLNVKDDLPGGRVIRVTSTPEAPVNGLHLCLKGRYGYEFIHQKNRLQKPLVREYLLNGETRRRDRGKWVAVDWDTALEVTAHALHVTRREFGPGSLGVLSSGNCTNEENFLLGKLARQVLNTNNLDSADHALYPSIADGLEPVIGWPAMSNSMDDIASQARSALVIGSPTTEQQPVFGVKLRQAALRRGLKLIVADPEFPNMAEYAAVYLHHRPCSEEAVVDGLMRIILENGWQDQSFIDAHTEGFAAFREHLFADSLDQLAQAAGVKLADLQRAADLLAHNRPAALIWSVGVARYEDPRPVVQALAHLQMLLGGIGVPGAGLNPLRTQNNQQGACDMGIHPDYLPGYQRIDDPGARARFEAAWGHALPQQPGLNAIEMIEAAGHGEVKALYIIGEDLLAGASLDPAQTARLRRGLQGCEFIVLQEILPTETSRYADVLLPGVSFAEKGGSFTNIERRVQLIRPAIAPLGEARLDTQIITALAGQLLALEQRGPAAAPYAGWKNRTPAQIMEEIAALAPIYAGISYARLEAGERLQWPVLGTQHAGTPVLPLKDERLVFSPMAEIELV